MLILSDIGLKDKVKEFAEKKFGGGGRSNEGGSNY